MNARFILANIMQIIRNIGGEARQKNQGFYLLPSRLNWPKFGDNKTLNWTFKSCESVPCVEASLYYFGVKGAASWLFGPKRSLQKWHFNPDFHMAAGLDTGFSPQKLQK